MADCNECGKKIKLSKKDKAMLKAIKMFGATALGMLGPTYEPILNALNSGVGKTLCPKCYETKVEDGARLIRTTICQYQFVIMNCFILISNKHFAFSFNLLNSRFQLKINVMRSVPVFIL